MEKTDPGTRASEEIPWGNFSIRHPQADIPVAKLRSRSRKQGQAIYSSPCRGIDVPRAGEKSIDGPPGNANLSSMATTFSHPKTLLSRHRRNTRLRLLLWALIGIPFWFFGLRMLLQGDGYAGVVFATVFTVLKMGFEIFFFAGSREILRLARTSVVLDGSRLEQRDENEVPLATISLDRPFDPGFYFNVLGQVVYRVEQEGTVLKFAAAIENAERLVKEVLASPDKWPPEIPEPKSGPSHYHAQAGR